ncbi:MAG: hypothetical protein JEZ06_06925 [Anaerolineaceae bacterium]|nr:hypothetical protein [Anaerolineaceae bacterium]
MFKKFLLVFFLIVLYMLFWFAIIFFSGTFILIPFVIIGFIPYMEFATKKAFHFKGEGNPISEEELRSLILEINNCDVPVIIHSKENQLIATWRYVDAKWWEIFAKAGLTEVYELHMKFNNKKKTVKLIDITKSVKWNAGPSEVSLQSSFFRGIIFEVKVGKQWGIKENFTLGKIYDYQYSSAEIKNPIMNSILQSGWDVQFASW